MVVVDDSDVEDVPTEYDHDVWGTTDAMEEVDQNQWWRDFGYLAGKQIDGGLWVVLMPMITTFRLAICDPGSVYDFYCFPHAQIDKALVAFARWEGAGDPEDGWVKHHASGRRREL